MSYGKKDEDSDQTVVKIDRTSVFQEGMKHQNFSQSRSTLADWPIYSSVIQLISNLS